MVAQFYSMEYFNFNLTDGECGSYDKLFKSRNLHIEDYMQYIMESEVTCNFGFAKSLNIGDLINIGCLETNTENGKLLIDVMNYTGCKLMVIAKEYFTQKKIRIHYAVIYEEYDHIKSIFR